MDLTARLEKPHWKPFLSGPTLTRLSDQCIIATDHFFEFVARNGLASPSPNDVHRWSLEREGYDQDESLELLRDAMLLLVPDFGPCIALATELREKSSKKPEPTSSPPAWDDYGYDTDWSPFEFITKPPIERHVSIQPEDLPPAVKKTIQRMADGLPANGVQAPSREIVKRLRDKLCQLASTLEDHDREFEFTTETIDIFQRALRDRCENGTDGVRWATIRATIEELNRYARYTGAPDELKADLAERLNWLEAKERCQRSLKLETLARSGHTTDSVLDIADALRAHAAVEDDEKKRHRLRNEAAVLAIYTNVPLRNSSAYLVFGKNLHWEGEKWVIRMMIRKTRRAKPIPFVAPIDPYFGAFLDAVLLGDAPSDDLVALRTAALGNKRPLFMQINGKPFKPSYIPRTYKELTGVSLTSARAMVHTDAARNYGSEGLELGKIQCHQTSDAVVRQSYYQENVAEILSSHLTGARNKRRAALLAKS